MKAKKRSVLAAAFVVSLSLFGAACKSTPATTSTTASYSGGNGGGGSPSASPASGVYTVTWQPETDPMVTGYRIYYAKTPFSSGSVMGSVDVSGSGVGSADLAPGNLGFSTGDTLYVAVSALGAGGLESPTSDVVSAPLN